MRRSRRQIAAVFASVTVAVGMMALAMAPAGSQVAADCPVSSTGSI